MYRPEVPRYLTPCIVIHTLVIAGAWLCALGCSALSLSFQGAFTPSTSTTYWLALLFLQYRAFHFLRVWMQVYLCYLQSYPCAFRRKTQFFYHYVLPFQNISLFKMLLKISSCLFKSEKYLEFDNVESANL